MAEMSLGSLTQDISLSSINKKGYGVGIRQEKSVGGYAVQVLRTAYLSLLIMLARYPAPKPLSMLTTQTPLAQLLSMVSRADRPLKLAP